jgi:uncharacterized protein
MTREQALIELKKYINNKNLLNHMYAAEVVMARLAHRFDQDEQQWAMAGLMHDIDYDHTKDTPELHALKGAEILTELGFAPEVVYAVKVHNDRLGLPRVSLMDKALYATDPLTGLIVAGALIRPEKKLSAVTVESLLKRFNEKSFAKGANREHIAACSELGLSLEEFITLGLEAMQGIAVELGL